jgi:hypothetical protein
MQQNGMQKPAVDGKKVLQLNDLTSSCTLALTDLLLMGQRYMCYYQYEWGYE